jgi:hypothetical protein
VSLEGGVQEITWASGGADFIGSHSIKQFSSSMIPSGYSENAYKFNINWAIKSPTGYSILVVHPLNRGDMPFQTLSGIVDTDDYNMPINLPFLLKSDFEGIIEAGTPIAQLIPIKREFWSHKIEEFDEIFSSQVSKKFFTKIYRVYKNLFWKRKDYK